MGKKLRNQVIALAVAASMTVPEAASAGAILIQQNNDIQENMIAPVQSHYENSLFSETEFIDNNISESIGDAIDLSKSEEKIAKFEGKPLISGKNGNLIKFTPRESKNSFIISGLKINSAISKDSIKKEDFCITINNEPVSEFEIENVSVSDDGDLTIEGQVSQGVLKSGNSYKVRYNDNIYSDSFNCEFSSMNFMSEISLMGTFDYFSREYELSDFDTIEMKIPASNADKFLAEDLSNFELSYKENSTSNEDLVPKGDSFELIDIKVEKIANDKNNVKLILNIQRNFEQRSYYLLYKNNVVKSVDGKQVSIKYSRKYCAIVNERKNAVGTYIDSNGVLTYNGMAADIVLKPEYEKKKISDVIFKGRQLKKIVLPNTITRITSKMFDNTVSGNILVLPDTITSVETNSAIDPLPNVTQILFNGDLTVIPEKARAKVYTYVNTVEAGQKIEIDIKAEDKEPLLKFGDNTILASGIVDVEKKNVRMITFESNEKEYTNDLIDWVLESPDGKSRPSGVIISDGPKATITNTVANGTLNNQIIAKAVSKINPNKVYAMLLFCITPSKTTEIIDPNELSTKGLSIKIGETKPLGVKAKDGSNTNLIYETTGDCFVVVNGTVKGISEGTGKIIVKSESNPEICKNIDVKIEAAEKTQLTADIKSLTLVNDNEKLFTVSTGLSVEKTVKFEYDDTLFEISDGKENIPENGTSQVTGEKTFHIKVKNSADKLKSGKLMLSCDEGKTKTSVNFSVVSTYQNVLKINESVKKLTDGVAVVNIPVNTSYNMGLSVLPASAQSAFVYEINTSKTGWKDTWKSDIKDEDNWNKNINRSTEAELKNGENVIASIKNGKFTSSVEGTYYVKAVTKGITADGRHLESNIYQINVYKPGGSIEWKDKSYVVQGGFLMTKTDAETICSKQIAGGSGLITFDAPLTAGNYEEIIWTSSNPGALNVFVKKVDKKADGQKSSVETMELCPSTSGTFTITGTTKYTKQKYAFKVTVADKTVNSSVFKASNPVIEVLKKNDNSFEWKSDIKSKDDVEAKPLELDVGTVSHLRVKTDVCAAKIAYKSSDSKMVSVDAKGNIKVLKADGDKTVTITATMTQKKIGKETPGTLNATIIIKPVVPAGTTVGAPAIKLSIPESVQNNTDDDGNMLIVSESKLKPVSDVKYEYYQYEDKISEGKKSENKIGDDVPVEGGLVVPGLELSKDERLKRFTFIAKYNNASIFSKKFNVYEVLATKVSVHPEDAAKVKRLGTKDDGLACGESVIIDLLAQGNIMVHSDPDDPDSKMIKKTVDATRDEIIWTSSNTFLANAVSIPHEPDSKDEVMKKHYVGCEVDGKKPYADSVKIIANKDGYTGPVTLTGTFTNSGKKVVIKINVKKS